jgi:hypothetical protein
MSKTDRESGKERKDREREWKNIDKQTKSKEIKKNHLII